LIEKPAVPSIVNHGLLKRIALPTQFEDKQQSICIYHLHKKTANKGGFLFLASAGTQVMFSGGDYFAA
jgi:hypothetical protein